MRKKKIDFDIDETSMAMFNNRVEALRKECDTYIEAVVSYCEHFQCSVEDVLPLISSGLKAKMKKEEVVRGTVIDDTLNLL